MGETALMLTRFQLHARSTAAAAIHASEAGSSAARSCRLYFLHEDARRHVRFKASTGHAGKFLCTYNI